MKTINFGCATKSLPPSFRWRQSAVVSASRMFCLLVLLAVHGCATQPEKATDDPYDEFANEQNDPLESLNRRVFSFNSFLDRWLLKPLAKGYQWVTPSFVDRGVSNFFNNLSDVPGLVNAGLQGDVSQMATSTGRVLVNSTVGIGGLMDVASDMGMERRSEDFGQTLAVWGVGEGAYVELPFLGGRNLRDAVAIIPDIFLNPVSYVDDQATRTGLTVLDTVDTRADLLALESFVAGDRYSFIRDVYRQRRQSAVANGELQGGTDGGDDDGFSDDFGDEDF